MKRTFTIKYPSWGVYEGEKCLVVVEGLLPHAYRGAQELAEEARRQLGDEVEIVIECPEVNA